MYGYEDPNDPIHELGDFSPYSNMPNSIQLTPVRRTLLASTIEHQNRAETARRKSEGYLPLLMAILFDNETNNAALRNGFNQIVVSVRSLDDKGKFLGDCVGVAPFEMTPASQFVNGLWYMPNKVTDVVIQLEAPTVATVTGTTVLTLGMPIRGRDTKAATFRVNLVPNASAKWQNMKFQIHSVPGQ